MLWCGVCPSVTFAYCMETAKDILNFFHIMVVPLVWFFPHKRLWSNFDGALPPKRGVECRWWHKNHDSVERPLRNSVKNCFYTENLTEIWQSAAELWPKNDFKKWRPSAILNFKGPKMASLKIPRRICSSWVVKKVSYRERRLIITWKMSKNEPKGAACRGW